MAGGSAAFARRTELNHRQVYAFSAGVGGLAAIFIFFHLLRSLSKRINAGKKNPPPFAVLSRIPRNILLRKVPGLPSGGHAIVILCYLAINLVATFVNIDTKIAAYTPNLASRAAWMAVANLVVVIFLALKNTPLAFLTAWSYERLNILHQIAGSLCVIFVIIHGSCYSSYFVLAGRKQILTVDSVIYGEIAGLSFIILGFSAAVIRRWWYELFYYIHITFWILAVVMVGLHQPAFGEKIVIVVISAASIWVLDRVIRMLRLLVYSANNSAILTPLPNGATRVTLKKAPLGAKSGEHSFLWIPRVRTFETHPFTISSTDPLEFVVVSHDGFTRDLHQYALAHPGVSVKASLEGSYGKLPNTKDYETVVLVAGGSGATFTFGMALNMLKKLSSEEHRRIIFIWVVKYDSQLTWFSQHLETLSKDSRVDLQLYVTRPSATGSQYVDLQLRITLHSDSSETDVEKVAGITGVKVLSSTVSFSSEKSTPVKAITLETDSGKSSITTLALPQPYSTHVHYEKPDVEALIRSAVHETPNEERVLVLGCGPDSLMKAVRNTTASCIRMDGPEVELHCEQFGW